MNNFNPLFESKAFRNIKYGDKVKDATKIIKGFAKKHKTIDKAVKNYKPSVKQVNKSFETSPLVKGTETIKKEREAVLKSKAAKSAKDKLDKITDKKSVDNHKKSQQIKKAVNNNLPLTWLTKHK